MAVSGKKNTKKVQPAKPKATKTVKAVKTTREPNVIAADSSTVDTSPPSSKNKLAYLGAVAAVLIIGLLAWQYIQAQNEVKRLRDTSNTTQGTDKLIADEVKRIVVLPMDETPTIRTVENIEQLKGNTAFDRAQNGDKVLIYTRSSLVVIYRPATKQIVNVASTAPQNAPPVAAPAPAPTPTQ